MNKDIAKHITIRFFRGPVILSGIIVFLAILPSSISAKRKPNIIFLLADQFRASATGYAGDPNVRTPNLDHLAETSYNFRNAVSVCPVCTPYRASLMTGRYPTSTGMFLNDAHLPASALSISDVLLEFGYKTAYIGKWHLDGHGRHAYIPPERRRGFQYWKAAECDHNYNHSHYYTGDSNKKLFWEGYDVFAETKDAQAYIKDNARLNKPFALFVSYGTPHFPHETAPESFKSGYPVESIVLPPNVPDSMRSIALAEVQGYYAHCEALDKGIGDILNTLEMTGLSKNTILVFTSDHGEMMGAHGVPPKQKQVPWWESAGVPFLIRYPYLHGGSGKEVEIPINTPDIFPTLLGLAGISIPSSVEGQDLSGIIKGDYQFKDRAVLYMAVSPFYKEHSKEIKEYRALKTAEYTFVCSLEGPWLLYNDAKDPYQLNNLIRNSEYDSLIEKFNNQLKLQLSNIGDDFEPGPYYIQKWGYKPAIHGSCPFGVMVENPQTPIKN